MKRPKQNPQNLPQYDYGLALQNAVSWLGDRYLLAQPVNRRPEPTPAFYMEPKRWHGIQPARCRKH